MGDPPLGLALRLSSGAASVARATPAPATRLSDGDTSALLARLQPIAAPATDRARVALRPGAPPPPATGATIASVPAQPSTPAPPAEAGPLRVVRATPEGKVPVAAALRVTFSQPMVAVGSQSAAAATIPVALVPEPRGTWRWIGTQTIVFDPEVRFPQATSYRVEIAAGTRSATGGAIERRFAFGFETPPPTLVSHAPSGSPERPDVPMFLMFDQKIDPAAVLASIAVTADGEPRAIRLLDEAELRAQAAQGQAAAGASRPGMDRIANLVEHARQSGQDGRWIAFRPIDDLPADAAITVEVRPGAPSAEGPLRTRQPQRFAFRTFPPLAIERARCGWDDGCRPGTWLDIEFNNPLDAARFDPGQLTITPALADAEMRVNDTTVSVFARTAARTRYRVVVSGGVVDDIGQRLGKPRTLWWNVGSATPALSGPTGMVVLDPGAERPTLDVVSTGYRALRVQLHAVVPADYEAFQVAMQDLGDPARPLALPGARRLDRRIAIAGDRDRLAETSIDLAPALGATGLGHVIAVVEPYPRAATGDPDRLITWLQSTRLGLDAYVDDDRLVAHASDLVTGAPVSGAAVEVLPWGIAGTSDERGLATLALPTVAHPGTQLVVARRGDDVTLVAGDSDSEAWVATPRQPELAWYVTDDRGLYRPGETVALKGWLRVIDPGTRGDVGGLAGTVTEVSYQAIDATGREIASGKAPVSAAGGFDARFALAGAPALGNARISLTANSQALARGSYTHGFRIEEFRRPEFEVSARRSDGPVLAGGSADVTVEARYFAGGPLPGAPVRWQVTAEATSFTPPGRDDYAFGAWLPWWSSHGADAGDTELAGERAPSQWALDGRTDITGAHVLHLDVLSVKPAVPMSVVASATVTDVNWQAWSASTPLLVHPSARYVGLKAARSFVDRGTPYELSVIGVDLDGRAVAGAAIEVTAVRLERVHENGTDTTKEVDPQRCAVVAAKDAVPCAFQTAQGGQYRVTATIVDDRGRPNQTTLDFWVSGGEPRSRDVAQEQVQIIPDKKEYTPGNTAELLLQVPFYPAEGVVTWQRSGIVKTEKITVDGPSKVITVPIAEAMVPNLHVQVDLVGAAARLDARGLPDPALPRRPAYAVGAIELSVPPRQRTLQVEVVPSPAVLGPGEKTTLALRVVDAEGRPMAGAEAAVIVVDEAILALTGHRFADPIDAFHPRRSSGTTGFHSRALVHLARPAGTEIGDPMGVEGGEEGGVVGGEIEGVVAGAAAVDRGALGRAEKQLARSARDGDRVADRDDRSPDSQVPLRTNFDPLAAFSPAVRTDGAGKATVEVTLPDSLTRYRVVAIAVAGDKQFGKGESGVTARLPLMVRASPPRFLNFGDAFELPVVVQNQTDSAMTVRLAARTSNAKLTAGAGREVVVPANDRVEVRFPAAAALAGTARFQLVGSSGRYSDATELALPVWTPATTEAFATYGVIDGGGGDGAGNVIKQRVALPGQVVPEFGGMEVSTASTNLQAVTDAMLYLVRYPYECAEQRASRVLAIAALRDVLSAFEAGDMPTAAELAASVAGDLERLSQMQNGDGGFAFWQRGYPSQPYLTVHVASALGRAQQKGFAVPAGMVERAKGYLRDIERHYPSYYSKEVRWAISAYALYTRKQLGELDVGKAKKLVAEAGVDKLSMEANGWLLGTLARQAGAAEERQAIVRHALNRVSETAGAANFTTSYGDGSHLVLASDRRVDGVMLEALIQEQKDLDLIPKLVTGLLGHRKAGRWLNTQENAFALLGLDRYFQTYEKATPNFVARVWLGDDYAGDHAFRGRTTDSHAIEIAMAEVAKHDRSELTIQKDGTGRLYYRVGMTYAPASLALAAVDHGFAVTRGYEAVDDPKDVVRGADGTWRIKAGARVRVRLTMVNENRRHHVALVDPLPAGLETMNPTLATTGPIPEDPNQQKFWSGPWYEHQNLRDERVEAFASLLWQGVHEYSYMALATTPGQFVVPPAKAEEMYMPETFGRGATDRVVIE